MRTSILNKTKSLIVALVLSVPAITIAQSENISYERPSYWRPYDQRGINVFESSKQADSLQFDGLRLRFGAGFTQQFQNLRHSNKFAADFTTSNKLYPLAAGFMTSQANLVMDVQLADGIRLNVTTYLSSRHHNEAWVKGGFIQFDKLPLKGKLFEDIMKVTTIRIGHMEVNYGDAHFRRSDGGQTIYNPFMESYILDAFATEIGGEVLVQKNGFFGMIGATNGMIKGNVDSVAKTDQDDNSRRSPSIITKAGFDKNIADGVRIRLSGSYYHNGSSAASGLTLYGGDRSGSNYQNVLEKSAAGEKLPSSTVIAFSGRLNPGFSKKVDAVMLNGFLKARGLELFGTYETARGRTKIETEARQFDQYAGDIVYRFGTNENLFSGIRYNTAKGELAGIPGKVTVDRFAAAAGWFLTRNILLKGEYVIQKYKDFPTTDYRSSGKFNGYVIEAVVGF